MSDTLPPCGIYRTTEEVASIPAGRLVYFHNHGSPGPGIYLPVAWHNNRAQFADRGQTLPEPIEETSRLLARLPDEGLYRVTTEFYCCDAKCRKFDENLLVQLGYNGAAEAILFVPEWTTKGIHLPTTGSPVSLDQLVHLQLLRIDERAEAGPVSAPTAKDMLH